MSHRITKKKIKTFLSLRFRKEPLMMYDDTLDVAIEVIQDFLNCDPLNVGRLQGNTYDTIYNIEKETPQEDWVKGYNKWLKQNKKCKEVDEDELGLPKSDEPTPIREDE